MNQEQLYEAIEAYLEGTLSAEARHAFEREIAADPQIRAEVALHQRMQAELSKSDKAELRAQLQQIAQEFPLEKKSRTLIAWLTPLSGAVAAAIIAAIIWWAWPRSASSGWQPEIAIAADSLPGGQTTTPDSLMAVKPETGQLEESPPLPPEQPSIAQLSADPFRPNPKLERLIATSGRDTNLLVSAAVDASPTPTEKFRAIVSGTLRSSNLIEEGQILVDIYDNEPDSYLKENPEASLPLELQRLDEEGVRAFGGMKNYTFEKKVEKQLPPGLYYYVIKREGEDAPLFIGKLEVKVD